MEYRYETASVRPQTLVYESEYQGAVVRVYADERGILVDTDQGALVMTNWSTWLLVQVFSMGATEAERWRVWARAASALHPGDDS